jgi:hypothetical protein
VPEAAVYPHSARFRPRLCHTEPARRYSGIWLVLSTHSEVVRGWLPSRPGPGRCPGFRPSAWRWPGAAPRPRRRPRGHGHGHGQRPGRHGQHGNARGGREELGCPSAAAVSAAAGTAYLPPQAQTRSGALDCTYQGNSTLLLISLAKSQFPASDLREVVANQPTGGGVKLTPVSGIGDAAFVITFTGAAEPGGLELIAQSGSHEVTVLGPANIGPAKAIARLALGL